MTCNKNLIFTHYFSGQFFLEETSEAMNGAGG